MFAFLLLIFSAFFCGFPRLFVVCRVLVRGGGFRFLWAYFMPVSVRMARDIFREREERKEKARRRCGGAPWLLLRCLWLVMDYK